VLQDSDADDAESGEPDKKKICTIEPHVASPNAGTQPSVSTPSLASAAPAPAMDLMESDLSDISDDADDILNAVSTLFNCSYQTTVVCNLI
jgi:hypothetical protein